MSRTLAVSAGNIRQPVTQSVSKSAVAVDYRGESCCTGLTATAAEPTSRAGCTLRHVAPYRQLPAKKCEQTRPNTSSQRQISIKIGNYYFVSATVIVDSSHMNASSSTLWSRFSPPSNFVNRHVSTMWFMVCRWPQSQEGDCARPHLCKTA